LVPSNRINRYLEFIMAQAIQLKKKAKGSSGASGAVLVLGGGVAGVQAALDLTELGYYVYLVEKSAAIGGAMAQLDKTFPTNDCSL